MTYEEIPAKNSKGLGKDIAIKSLDQLSTSRILWQLAKRHKTGLLLTWAITMTVIYFMPFMPALIVSILT